MTTSTHNTTRTSLAEVALLACLSIACEVAYLPDHSYLAYVLLSNSLRRFLKNGKVFLRSFSLLFFFS